MFIKKAEGGGAVLIIELGREETPEALEKQLPKRFAKGWIDYTGGANATAFRDHEFEVVVDSEQQCDKHTLVEVNTL